MAEEGAVTVCVRLRPLNSREEALGEDGRLHWEAAGNAVRQVDGGRSFGFDRVFDSTETTKHVYEEIAVPIIDSAIQGYNGTIFAYGQTASGKTYTMMGSKDYLGVIPRAMHDIFQKIKKFPEREFLLRVSYMEIYNETITDLLCDTMKMKPLIIREDFNRSVYVSDLTEEVVNTTEMALKFITKGEKNRHYGVTKMNQRSSRSHTIFRMILESREKREPSNCDGSVKVSHLNLVDLAGSERAAQTGAEGVRFKEGCNINRSLFILGQVIKRLSNGQAGGFINYRDSKLTRILQNSLGGNAKTRIICTVTPMSYDETLSTLQFASTAKHMKNTPCVNEVSSDEALLKRYRKEIMDLKKQLEEVSLETRAQAMQKDQLAQLLEEKDLLQKVQNEKIQNLTQMLVTSSSLTSQQELKAKIKRRVTWCPGKINKMKHANFMDELNVPADVATVTHRVTLSSLGEIDESLCSEADVFSNTLDSLAEVEWNPATKLLSQEALEAELSSLRATYDNLVLDYEQLQREHREMGLKLKEKEDLDEFEALEKKVEKDQEMQLIHEISNLKNLVKHAEVYNQDLENELSSKTELLQEKEEQIKTLQSRIDSQVQESTQTELPSDTSGATADLDRMKQSLLDAETVALDSKRESAFLRSENLRLKENLEELSDVCRQKERDVQACQKQLEAKKKMQADLEKELQSSYSEVSRLSGLLEGRVPRDLLSSVDLERKIAALQKELRREANEKEGLRQEVDALSGLRPLPSEVEKLQRELDGKCEELRAMASEREKLSYDMAERERRIQDLLRQLEETGNGPAAAQSLDPDAQARQHHLGTLEQGHRAALEENATTSQEVDALRIELSQKTQQPEQVVPESQEGVLELEQLRAQAESGACSLQAEQRDEELSRRLREALGQVEKLQQQQESLRAERDQLRLDIQDMVVTNIDTQEQLRGALELLKQHQQAAGTAQLNPPAEAPGAVGTVTRAQGLDAGAWQDPGSQAVGTEGSEPAVEQRASSALAQEHAELQQRLDRLTAEKEQLQADLAESIEMAIENQEELRLLREELKRQQGENRSSQGEELRRSAKKLAQAEEELTEKSRQLQESQQRLVLAQEEARQRQLRLEEAETLQRELRAERAEAEAEARAQAEELRAGAREREKLAAQLREMEASGQSAQEELRAAYTALEEQQETVEKLRRQVAEKTVQVLSLQECKERPAMDSGNQLQQAGDGQEHPLGDEREDGTEETTTTTEQLGAERAALTGPGAVPRAGQEEPRLPAEEAEDTGTLQLQEALVTERDRLRETVNLLTARHQETVKELEIACCHRREQEETIHELRVSLSERGQEVTSLQEELERTSDELRKKNQELEEKQEQLSHLAEPREAPDIASEPEQLKEDLAARAAALQRSQSESLRLAESLQERQEELAAALQERDQLRRAQEALQTEREHLTQSLREMVLEVQERRALEAKMAEQVRAAACELEAAREQCEAQKAALQSMEIEKAQLAQRLQDTLQEASQTYRDRDGLRGAKQAARVHKDQLEAGHREAACRTQELEQQEELADSLWQLEEQQVTLEELRVAITEKTDQVCGLQRDLENSTAALDAQTCALQEKAWQLLEVENSLRESTQEAQRLREQLQTATSALENAETERLRLTQELRESLGEAESLAEERESLRWAAETAAAEQGQLRERLQEAEATIQELQASESHGSQERQKAAAEIEQLRRASQDQSSALSRMEMENLNFAQRLHDSTEELKAVTEERDSLKRAEAALSQERDQLRDSLQETTARELETQQQLKVTQTRLEEYQETIAELKARIHESSQLSHVQKDPPGSAELSQGKAQKDPQEAATSDKRRPSRGQQPTESLRDKCLRVKELLRKFPELQQQQRRSLDSLSADLEKEIRLQEALSARVREKLSLRFPQAGPAHKLLACSLSCSLEFLRVLEKLQYVLDNITTVKEEHHTALSKLEAACVDGMDEQEQLLGSQPPGHSRASWALRLGQKLDLHIQEVGRDISENDFQGMRADLEEVLGQRRELTRFLEAWQATPTEPERLREHLQRDTDRLGRVNCTYSNKMVAMMYESTLFEQSCSTVCREWEQELRALREENLCLLHARREAVPPQLPGTPERDPTKGDGGCSAARPDAGAARPRVSGDEARLVTTQRELEAAREAVARLQRKMDELDRHLATSREENRALQNRVSLGAQPYKEEIEELKMHLVKTDLEKKQQAKEFEKEMASMRASAEHQQGIIRVLKEELRRRSQAQDTSMISEPTTGDPSPPYDPHKPWTCGGGSGIVQSTKALILRSEYVRLEKENGRLRRQNQQLLRPKGQLSSVGTQHPPEAPDTQERAPLCPAPRERTADMNLGPSAWVTARKRPTVSASPCKERNAPDPTPGFSDTRTKSLPTYPPTRFFDNSGLGLCPEPFATEDEGEPARSGAQPIVPECKVQ